MKNTLTAAPAATAETLAANFQVSELEPRLENAWADTENPEPACLKTNTCHEQL